MTNKTSVMKIIGLFSTVVVGVVTLVGGYYQFVHRDIVQVEVRTIDKMRLDTHNVENLTIKYLYQDSIEVNNVWTMRYVISNVGSKTIIAKGSNSNILPEYLPITIENSIQVLSFEVASNFPVTTRQENNKILLDFRQWRRNEYIDIVALIQSKNDTEPFMSIDDRDIIDAEIIFSEYRPAEFNANRKLIDHLPRWLAVSLKWVIVVIIFFVAVMLIWTAYKQLKADILEKSKLESIAGFVMVLFVALMLCVPLLWMF